MRNLLSRLRPPLANRVTGLSARVCQTFRGIIKPTTSQQVNKLHNSGPSDGQASLAREIMCRTYWASFMVECMLSSGKNLPANHHHFDLSIPLPSSEDDFEFGSVDTAAPQYLDHDNSTDSECIEATDQLGLENIQRIFIGGFETWARLSSWIVGGGRRTPHPSSACVPWAIHSHWTRLSTSLRRWEANISPRLLYSTNPSSLKVFLSRGHGETFATINLLYFLNVAFLHREYIPFFGHRVKKPCGPVDPPLIDEIAPDGWWENGSREMFQAAESTVRLMQSLEEKDSTIETPFTCFCVYIAGAMLCYLDAWPHMAPEVKNAKQSFGWTLKFLESATLRWPICRGWRKTMLGLDAISRHINSGAGSYSHFGRDEFVDMEDRLHRFTDTEAPEPDTIVASFRESRQHNRVNDSSTILQSSIASSVEQGSSNTTPPIRHPEPQAHASASRDPLPDPLAWYNDTISEFTASQDFLASILGTEPMENFLLQM